MANGPGYEIYPERNTGQFEALNPTIIKEEAKRSRSHDLRAFAKLYIIDP